MDLKQVEEIFDAYYQKSLKYFKSLSNIGIAGWSLLGIGLILLIIALFL